MLPAPEPHKGAETDSRAKFGNETIAGAYRRPKWFGIIVPRLTQGVPRLCSGSAQVRSPLTQVKVVAAPARRPKRNQRG